MAILGINFSAKKRRKLGFWLSFFHLSCAACGLAFMGLGIYIKIRISAWLTLVDDYNDNLLPVMMVIVGVLLVVVDVAGWRLIVSANHSPRVRYLLIPYLCIVFILNLCILTAGIICFVHRQQLASAFHRGLLHAMQRYKNHEPSDGEPAFNLYKTEIDLVHMELQCCGNNGYEDWFDVQWINNQFIDLEDQNIQRKMTNGKFLNDDVPFSCCDPNIARNCIHHHIQDNDMHYNYDFQKDLTIFTDGCKDKLMDYYSLRLGNVGAIVMAMFCIQTCILIGLRYLQTALHNADQSKDPDADSQGWLFEKLPAWGKKHVDWREKETDVESGEASVSDSFDSDIFDSDEEEGDDTANYVSQGDTTAGRMQDEPIYANVPFHKDKEKLKETLNKIETPPSRPTTGPTTDKKTKSEKQKKPGTTIADSKKAKQNSSKKVSKKETLKSPKEDSPKKSPKKETSKSPKQGSQKKSSKKETSQSPKKDSKEKKSKKQTLPVSRSKKPTAKSPSKTTKTSKRVSPKSPKSTKVKSNKVSGKSVGKSTKKSPRMKNKNNNIRDSWDDEDESDTTDTTPLLAAFYSSLEEEEFDHEPTMYRIEEPQPQNYNTQPQEVTWLLSRTQFYSTPPDRSTSEKLQEHDNE